MGIQRFCEGELFRELDGKLFLHARWVRSRGQVSFSGTMGWTNRRARFVHKRRNSLDILTPLRCGETLQEPARVACLTSSIMGARLSGETLRESFLDDCAAE